VVQAFRVMGGNLAGPWQTFTTLPTPDGMCVDTVGNLYVGTRKGVQVWDPRTGKPWGLIALPGLEGTDRATDCEFAEAGMLYISAVSKLFRVQLSHPGAPARVPGLPIGYCTGGEGRSPEEAKGAGFEFVEVRLRDVAALSDQDFARLEARTRVLGIPVLAAINLLPADLKVVGPQVDRQRQHEYLSRALARGARLGVKLAAFGSGGARQAPAGYPREAAWKDLVDFGRRAGRVAREQGMTVVIEALRREETNMINTVAEALALVRAVADPGFQLLVDHYHMSAENEDPAIVLEARGHIRHVQLANPDGRAFPRAAGESHYASLFRYLDEIGYRGGISIEARTTDFASDAPRAISLLRQLLAGASRAGRSD
jgi:D-psicose/D-tagatose/L-ribulose 3-epimerase